MLAMLFCIQRGLQVSLTTSRPAMTKPESARTAPAPIGDVPAITILEPKSEVQADTAVPPGDEQRRYLGYHRHGLEVLALHDRMDRSHDMQYQRSGK